MMRLTRAIQTLSEGGAYQHEVLRFLEEIIEVLERIEEKMVPNYGIMDEKSIAMKKAVDSIPINKVEICPEPNVEVKKVVKKCGRPKGWSPKKK
jgi:hypothetical protein